MPASGASVSPALRSTHHFALEELASLDALSCGGPVEEYHDLLNVAARSKTARASDRALRAHLRFERIARAMKLFD